MKRTVSPGVVTVQAPRRPSVKVSLNRSDKCTYIGYRNVGQKDAPQCQHHQQYGQSGGYLASGMPLSVSRYPGRPARADIHDTTLHLHR